jgi:hypothetical protein
VGPEQPIEGGVDENDKIMCLEGEQRIDGRLVLVIPLEDAD